MSDANGIAGNDDSFVAFAFAIVSIVAMFMFFPFIIAVVRDAIAIAKRLAGQEEAKRRSRFDEDDKPTPLMDLYEQVIYLPNAVFYAVKNPAVMVAGAMLLKGHSALTVQVCAPQFLKFCVRPKLIVGWLWIILLTSAMYASLSFDAHGILGVATSATDKEIKSKYRKLSKINHPDHNKTEEAKVFYPQLRKAYKALIDREAYEKELEKENNFSVGIALPSFMTSHEHDGAILFTLLAVLIILPIAAWYWFKGDSLERLRKVQQKVQDTEAMLEPIYKGLGIPKDYKYMERRREHQELVHVLMTAGLLEKGNEGMLDGFPALHDFRSKVLEHESHRQSLERLGFDAAGLNMLRDFFKQYKMQARIEEPEDGAGFVAASDSHYEASVYMIKKINAEVAALLDEIPRLMQLVTGAPDAELRVTRKILRHHDEVVDTLAQVYKGKAAAREVKFLVEATQKRDELIKEIPKELQAMIKKIQQYMQYEQQQQAQQAKQTRRPQQN